MCLYKVIAVDNNLNIKILIMSKFSINRRLFRVGNNIYVGAYNNTRYIIVDKNGDFL